MNARLSLRISAAAVALCALVACSCDEYPTNEDNNDNTPKLRISVQAGDNQSERVGASLPDAIVVRVSDALNNPRPGVQVFFNTSDRGAVAAPSGTTTDGNGLAWCTFKLGTTPGAQHVLAFMKDDSITVTATAQAIACSEESLTRVCQWNAGHIYVATTGSSLLTLGTGSVILDFDPGTRQVSKVLETSELLDGLGFSARGELFATGLRKIFKVNHATQMLETYIEYSDTLHMSIEPNEGGILAGVCEDGPLRVKCPPSTFTTLLPPHAFPSIQWENLAVNPITRDLFIIDRYTTLNFKLWRIFWDGRTSVQTFGVHADLTVGAAVPRGMCSDPSGTIYITFDGNDNYRRIVSVSADGVVNDEFFNFYTHAGGNNLTAGRWGDIACLDGKLYLIDRRNDRLVIISTGGAWLDEVKDTAFSRPFDESDHYAIAASPTWFCTTTK